MLHGVYLDVISVIRRDHQGINWNLPQDMVSVDRDYLEGWLLFGHKLDVTWNLPENYFDIIWSIP